MLTYQAVFFKAAYHLRVTEQLFDPIHAWEVETPHGIELLEFVLLKAVVKKVIGVDSKDGITGERLIAAYELFTSRVVKSEAWKATCAAGVPIAADEVLTIPEEREVRILV